jgi:hypothetical protein
MSSNIILMLISAVPVYLMWTATSRISTIRMVPIRQQRIRLPRNH